jgi:hypothetical protein
MLRRKAPVFIVTLLVTASLLTVFSGCRGVTQTIVGSGNLITQEMDATDFTKLEISHVFQATVTRSDSFSVTITVDNNLLGYVVVRKSGSTLRIYLKAGYAYIGTTKMVEITMPKIDKLSLSGASQGEVSGFRSSQPLEFEASGASSLNIDDIKAGDTGFEISGASHISGGIEISEGRFNVSGASSIDLEGFASDISLEVSGASQANLTDFPVSNATVRISGASAVIVNASGSIDGNVSGVSSLFYLNDPALTIEMSGD